MSADMPEIWEIYTGACDCRAELIDGLFLVENILDYLTVLVV